MSEDHPQYIPCASGNQLMTDLLIRRHGDLVEIVGHLIVHLTPQDARRAAVSLLALADSIDGQKTPYSASVALLEGDDGT